MPEIENKKKDSLFCPILSRHSDMLEDCGKEKCGFWMKEDNCCAIITIARCIS